jgi:flagellin
MVVQHNLSAENALRYNGYNTGGLSKSLEKLSSGFKINRAGDNAAGLAVSEKMRAQLRGIEQAVNNAQDGISMVQTFEGALTESHNILRRIKTLAAQSANGTYDDQVDRAAIELEYEQLCQELDDIADTDFNGVRVLNVDGAGGTAGAGGAGTPAATHTADLSALNGTDFSAQFKQSFVDVALYYDYNSLAATYEAPANPVELSSGGAISFAYSLGATSDEIVFDVMQGGKSIGKGVYTFDDYVFMGPAESVSLTGTNGEDFGKISLLFGTSMIFDPVVYLTEIPTINDAILPQLADAIDSFDEGTGKYEVTYTPPTDLTKFFSRNPVGSYLEGNPFTSIKAEVYNPLNKGVTFRLYIDGSNTLSYQGELKDLENPGDTATLSRGTDENGGTFTVKLISGSPGNYVNVPAEIVDAPFSSLNLETRIRPHPAVAQTTISGMSAAPTEISGGAGGGAGGDPGTPGDVTTTATGVSLQVGARTKDLKEYDFEYEGVWGGVTALQKSAIGDLVADINSTAKGLGLVTADVNLSTQTTANTAIDKIDNAINKISMVRATFGAIQNRLEHKVDNLNQTDENLTAAESRIRDTDMSKQVSDMTRWQILSQASQAMLAQANQLPQSVLQLIQG